MPKLDVRGIGARVGKLVKKPRKKWLRNVIVGLVILAIGAGGFAVYKKLSGTATATAQQIGRVTRGDVSKIIEGSGTIAAIDQYEITSLAKGEIIADYVTEGQQVEKDDLLYQIDTSDMTNDIQKAQASLEKSQLSNQQNQETLENLTVRAQIGGVIQTLSVKNGDNVGNGSQVAEIVNTDYMRLKTTFHTDDARQLWVGQDAVIHMEGSFSTLSGTVDSIASGSLVNGDGVAVTSVELKVENPGGIRPNDKATALVGEIACTESGVFSYYETQTVLAKAAGEVYDLNYKEGDTIRAGATLLRLDSASAVSNARQGDLSVRDAQLSLQKSYEQLEDYSIRAPIAGKVIQKTSKAGDKLESGTNSTVMCIIADLSTLVFEISVDELDISNISVGQKVEITADALEGQTFTGVVDNVSIVGTASNGVTSYPVKVVVDGGESTGLIPGMNVNASIVIESRENVLRVPLSAVRRGNVVIVKDDGTATDTAQPQDGKRGRGAARPEGMPEQPERSAKGDAPEGLSAEDMPSQPAGGTAEEEETAAPVKTPDAGQMAGRGIEVPAGYKLVQVEVGLSDDSFTEITSGLSEGQTVLLPDTTASASSEDGMRNGGMPGGGMPGGGMPGGGMPGGGSRPGGGGMSGGGRGGR